MLHSNLLVSLFQLLLQCTGCDVNLPGQKGMTPLHIAAQLNYQEIADMLVLLFVDFITYCVLVSWIICY